MPKKNRVAIYEYLFKEGVLVAKKDFTLPKHPEIDVPNLHVIKALTVGTVMILSFRTDRPGQTVQTQIRLLLEEQSDQGLRCLPFRLHRLDSFAVITIKFQDFTIE